MAREVEMPCEVVRERRCEREADGDVGGVSAKVVLRARCFTRGARG